MASNLKLLSNSRKYTRKLVTENHNKKDSIASLSDTQKKELKAQLTDYHDTLKDLNEKVQALKWAEGENLAWLNEDLKDCEDYFRKIRECLVLVDVKTLTISDTDNARSLLKSPTAPLPTFKSQENENLLKFFSDFEEITNMFNYSNYDKFILLKQQVSGRALTLINSLESDKRGYDHAKDLLVSALASSDIRTFNVIKQLSEMKLEYGSDPFEYVSKMRNITESVKKLKLDADSFLRYFFWIGLNDRFKEHMTQITNSSKPTLKELNDNFFEASDRYMASQKVTRFPKYDKKVTYGAAANVNYDVTGRNKSSFKPCSLCSKLEGRDADHPIFKCNKFATAKEKVDKINSYKGCLKCADLGHFSNKCQFRLHSRCRFCKGWHFSFLCLKGEDRKTGENEAKASKATKENTSNPGKPSEATTSNLAVTEALKSDISCDSSLLPTFSCTLETGLKIRALKDGGCQSNFISERVVKSQNLKVLLDDVSLKINGINVTKEYQTKLIEVPLFIGGKRIVLEALMLPSIRITLKSRRLGDLVQGILNKGYDLADDFLLKDSEEISNLDFILGTRNGYCLPETETVFGREGKSILSQTPYGVLLKGEVNTFLEDLDFLSLSPSAINVQSAGIENCNDNEYFGNCLNLESDHAAFYSSTENFYVVPENETYDVTDEDGKLIRSELEKATKDILRGSCEFYTHYDQEVYDLSSCDLNKQLVKYTLDNTVRDEQGRLVMPLLWNAKVSHLLGKNQRLSTLILQSNLKKWQKNKIQLQLMDETIKTQEKEGIIERIENLPEFLKDHPSHSFLPHMGVFRMDRETTKCRIVFLSNLCERDPSNKLTVSHNQAIHPGPCLNQKLGSAILHIRFDEKLLCFDLCKAFNQISLRDLDANRLLFLWYKNVSQGDFSLVGYRNVRLSFGLRCSPAVLLLGLYKLLVLDAKDDPEKLKSLKRQIYSLCYMDNCAVSCNTTADLKWAYSQLKSIFEPYQFSLQQFLTNDHSLQKEIDEISQSSTPAKAKLLGLQWDKVLDTVSTKKIELDVKATTKREILSTIASHFDLFSFNGPILNRGRIFLHELQCNKNLGWDEKLSDDLLKEWRNIVRQANATPEISIERFVGKRSSSFKLIAFADSSKVMFGIVVYILEVESGRLSFVLAKNRIVNKQLENKSIPSLELNGIDLAAECLIDLYKELSGTLCMNPISIVGLEIYSDSLVALTWINSYTNKLSKMQKRSVFVMNRIHHINTLCEIHPIKFSFISGFENPADAITRCLSYRKLEQSNFFSGPAFLNNFDSPELSRDDILSFIVPNPHSLPIDFERDRTNAMVGQSLADTGASTFERTECLVRTNRFSSFRRLASVHRYVLKFIHKIKTKLKERDPTKFAHLDTTTDNFYAKACQIVILRDQQEHYSDIFDYFHCKDKRKKDLPNLVGQINVYMDQDGLLRVRSKCERIQARGYTFPLLLAKQSTLTKIIILDIHKKKSHAGCYSVLAEIRKKFYVPHIFSVVKKTLKDCVGCRRFKSRTIKLNQSPYRDWRINPPNIPYRYIFMDHLGPLWVNENGKKIKVWILCLTCLWSRAINLKICSDLSVREFMRAFQLHTFENGLPEYCISDLGSQFVSASNVITDYLKDHETQTYFQENGVKSIRFDQFAKGRSELGSMVESCVKLTKRLIFGAIGNNVLPVKDFEFLIAHTNHLINRRPVAFKESLRDNDGEGVPESITPECLIRGYDLLSVNVIPELHDDSEISWEPQQISNNIRENYEKLKRVRSKLIALYQDEFLGNLIHQATNVKDRYVPISHKTINPGDIVLLKEQHTKPNYYPLGLVKSVVRNSSGEVTEATILKGNSRELVRRHSSVLVPLLTLNDERNEVLEENEVHVHEGAVDKRKKPRRKAALESEQKTKDMLNS